MRDFGDDHSAQARLRMEFRAKANNSATAFITWEKYFAELGDGDVARGRAIYQGRPKSKVQQEFLEQHEAYIERQKNKKKKNIHDLLIDWKECTPIK
jgi:hypothetical protein